MRDQLLVLDRLLVIEPTSPAANFHRASLLIKAKRYQEAVDGATRAIEAQPGFSKALNTRAWARLYLDDPKQWELGLADATEAIRLSPAPTYYDTRGCLRMNLRQAQEALHDFDIAVKGEPSADHLSSRAQAYRALGRVPEAEQDEAQARRAAQNP